MNVSGGILTPHESDIWSGGRANDPIGNPTPPPAGSDAGAVRCPDGATLRGTPDPAGGGHCERRTHGWAATEDIADARRVAGVAGGNLDELKSMRPVIESWAKQLGCARVTLAGRKGWEKTFLKDEGYEPKWFMLSKEL